MPQDLDIKKLRSIVEALDEELTNIDDLNSLASYASKKLKSKKVIITLAGKPDTYEPAIPIPDELRDHIFNYCLEGVVEAKKRIVNMAFALCDLIPVVPEEGKKENANQ